MKRLLISSLALAILGLVCLAEEPAGKSGEAPLDSESREAFLVDLERSFSKIRTLRVGFRQERHLELFVEPLVSEGILIFSRPGRLHWEWSQPYGSLLVLRDGRIARFDIEDGKLRRLRPAGEEMLQSVALQLTRWLQGRFRDSSDLFTIEVFPGPPARIALLARSEGMAKMLSRIELELKPGPSVSQVRLYSPRGDTTVIVFSDEVRNHDLPEKLFALDSPAVSQY